MTSKEVGRRIRLARRELDMTQTDLGQRLKRHRGHAAVSLMETGRMKLGVEDLEELATILHKSLAYFYTVPPAPPAPLMLYRGNDDLAAVGLR